MNKNNILFETDLSEGLPYKPHPLHNKLRRISRKDRYGFIKKTIKATLLAKILAFILLAFGSFLLALIAVAEPFAVKIILPAVALPFIGMAAVLCNPESKFMENRNEVWGAPRYLRKKVKAQLELEQSVKSALLWCKDAFVDISEKNYDYLLLVSDYSKYCKAAKETVKGITAFSLGKIDTADSPLYIDAVSVFETPDDKEYIEWAAEVEGERQIVSDLQMIWKSYLGVAKIPREYWTYSGMNREFIAYGKSIGIESAIDAYISGVPAADIVA